MALIVKNTTGSDIFINSSGQNVPASGQITVDPKLYGTYSGSVATGQPSEDTAFVAQINSGDIVINDSIRDLTAAEGLRFLEDFQITSISINNTPVANNVRNVNVIGQDVSSTVVGDTVNITVGGEDSNIGRVFTLIFGETGSATNEYLDNIADGKTTDDTPHVVPFPCEVIAYTFSNSDDNSDTNIEIYSVAEGNGNGPATLKDTWSLTDTRTARKSNFGSPITFAAGDKIVVFVRDAGTDPDNVTFTMYLKITANESSEFSEEWSGSIDPA